MASDGFAAISVLARARGCHWQRLVVRSAGEAARYGGRRALGRRSLVRRQAIVAGSVRALPWADDAAVRGAFVERAQTRGGVEKHLYGPKPEQKGLSGLF